MPFLSPDERRRIEAEAVRQHQIAQRPAPVPFTETAFAKPFDEDTCRIIRVRRACLDLTEYDRDFLRVLHIQYEQW